MKGGAEKEGKKKKCFTHFSEGGRGEDRTKECLKTEN